MKEFSIEYDFKSPATIGGDDMWIFNVRKKTATLIEDVNANFPKMGRRIAHIKFTTDEEVMIRYDNNETWELCGSKSQDAYRNWLLDNDIEKELSK